MRQAFVISITSDRQLEIPAEIQETLQPGDEYMIWQSGDTILLQKVQKPLSLSDLRAKVEALGADPEEPTLEELSQIIREIRQQQGNP
jgi:bifunctional DNA-binding transcriptional regulator/antitoxin component of YhaV-PrlF toxin-antitoxin module